MAKRAEQIQSLGERIRMMRERQHLNIKELAEKTGYKEEYLNKIEEGKISPPVGALISVSRALAVDSKALLSEDEKKRRQNPHLIVPEFGFLLPKQYAPEVRHD